MNSLVVGVGDCLVSGDPESILVTYALGSCIAVTIHDPVAKVGGMLHFMLPDSSVNPSKAKDNPYLFADSGIPRLFQEAYRLGAEKRRLVVTATGGAQIIDSDGLFNIGKRNYTTMRKIFWKAGVMVRAEDVGGTASRTVRMEVGTGRVMLHGPGQPETDLQLAGSPSGKESLKWPTTY